MNAQPLPVLTGLLMAITVLITTGSSAQDTKTVATPNQMVDALHSAFGKNPHARAVHAKGIILEGQFAPAPSASTLSKAPHLQKKTVPVTLHFSDFTGIPDIPDTVGASHPRGLAIKFQLPDNATTDIVAHSFNGFPVATTDEFRTFLLALSASGPTAPKPTPIEQFLATHPITKTFVSTQKPPSVSYATLAYFGVNAFKFTNQAGQSHFVRYQFVPVAGEQFLTRQQLTATGPDYLQEEIRTRVTTKPVQFYLYAQVAQNGDPIENPSIAWPDSRQRVLLGTITIGKLAPNTLAEDKALLFMPNNVPDGIAVADPMLLDRSKAYPVSFGERQQDPAAASHNPR